MGISRSSKAVVFAVGLIGTGAVLAGCKDPGCTEEGLCAAPASGCHFASTDDPCGTCRTVCDQPDGGDEASTPDGGDADAADAGEAGAADGSTVYARDQSRAP